MKSLGLAIVFLATISSTYGHPLDTFDDVKVAADKPYAADDLAAMDDPCFSANDKHRLQCMKKFVFSMVKSARASFESGEYPSAIGQLEEAKQYDPGNPLLYFDEALIFSRLGERQKAVNQLDLCIWLAQEGHKKEDAELFRARLLTQEIPSQTIGRSEAKKMEEVNHDLESLRSLPRWQIPPGAETQLLCRKIQNEEGLEETSRVIFNKAFCAEIRGDMATAAKHFGRYVDIAPQAQDAPRVREHIILLSELSGLPGDAGERLRKEYGDVALYSSINQFGNMFECLKRADDVLPDFLETKRELAKLAVRRADFDEARRYYNSLKLHPQYRDEAEEQIDWINWNEQDYKDAVQAAANVIAILVQSRLDTHDPESTTFRRGMEQVGQYLSSAIAISDLGTDAHSLLATASLMTGNYILATDSTDIVFAHGSPLIFFNREGRRVEVWPDKIVVRDVSAMPPAVRLRPMLPEDQLSPILPEDQVAPTKIPISSISSIAVKESSIQLSLVGDELTFTPAFTGPVQEKGPLARKHANNYVKLIARYALIPQIRYGTERLNKKEFGELGIEMLAIAASFYLMTQGQISGEQVSKWQRMTRLEDGLRYMLMARESARVIVFFVEVLKERQRVSELPTLRFLPSREPQLEFKEAW